MRNVDVGDVVRVYAKFRSGGSYVDPGAVAIRIQDPSGNETGPFTYAGGTVSKASTGIYYYDLTIDEAGQWYARTNATGAYQGSNEDAFYVRTSVFA